jgi:hypothetical protein
MLNGGDIFDPTADGGGTPRYGGVPRYGTTPRYGSPKHGTPLLIDEKWDDYTAGIARDNTGGKWTDGGSASPAWQTTGLALRMPQTSGVSFSSTLYRATSPQIDHSKAHSIEARVTFYHVSGFPRVWIWGEHQGGSSTGVLLRIHKDGTLELLENGSQNFVSLTVPATSYTVTLRLHISAARVATCYVDDVLRITKTLTLAASTLRGNVGIGGDCGTGSGAPPADVDNVIVRGTKIP